MLAYFIIYFAISVVGFSYLTLIYSIHLLDVVQRIPTLQNVIRAITDNTFPLIMMSMLMSIIIYIFTVITFFYLWDTMYIYGINAYDSDIAGENLCLDIWDCFLNTMSWGLRMGGGVGEVTKGIYYGEK